MCVSWEVNPLLLSHRRGGDVSVSGLKPGEDVNVSKPVNHRGMRANTLHKPL